MFGTILYFMCIYLCSHIICYNEKENRRKVGKTYAYPTDLLPVFRLNYPVVPGFINS